MPVLASEDKIAPKSLLRHRPIGEGMPTANRHSIATSVSSTVTPVKKRASRPPQTKTQPGEQNEHDIAEWRYADASTQQLPKTVSETAQRKSHTSQPQPQPAAKSVVKSENLPQRQKLTKQQKQRWNWYAQHPQHPLLYLGVAMLIMIVGWMLFSALSGWLTMTVDQLRYGYPRTYQVNAWVGQNEQTGTPSHFIALNLKGHIEIIEFPGGDASHARVFVGPQLYGPNADLIPVTLSFVDINHDHKPDMIVTFQNTHIIFINAQGTFRLPLASEQPKIEQTLQHLP